MPPAELAGLRRERVVTQALLVEGRHRVRVYAPDGGVPQGFEAVAPSLEDAYLVLMRTDAALTTGMAGNGRPGAGVAVGAPPRQPDAVGGARP